jgi:hypothetical protein
LSSKLETRNSKHETFSFRPSPAAIEKSIYAQFQKGNFEKGMEIYFAHADEESKMFSASEKALKIEMIKGFAEKVKEDIVEKGGLKDFEIVSEEIEEDGATAFVESKLTFGDGSTQEETTKYVKNDGKWKIALEK